MQARTSPRTQQGQTLSARNRPRERPGSTGPPGPSPTPRRPAQSAEAMLRVTQTRDAAAELAAWGAAVAHLHAAGLPAAVPPFPAAWLARCGIRADWASAA